MGMDRQLLESLAKWRDSTVVILGVGNLLKGDDAAGPAVCDLLSGRVSARVINAETAPENYIHPVLEAAPDLLLIVDAVDSGGPPGQIRLFETGQIRRFAWSTHTLSIHLLVEVLCAERAMEVYLLGIQPGGIGLGADLSPPIQQAIQTIAETLEKCFPL